jgi:hypothetical protein
MSIRTLAVAAAGIAAAVFFWPRAEQPAPVVNVSSTPAAQAPRHDTTGARTYSSKRPLLASGESGSLLDLAPSETPAKINAPRATTTKVSKDETAVRPVASDVSAKRISSTKPGDAEAREQLVRDIQYELKRAGCYEGEVHGSWNNNTKQAMQTFTQRMNASLPVDQPDYVLLTLLQAQKAQSCRSGCPAGQVAEGGRCLPRAIVAQQPNGSRTPATSSQTLPQDSLAAQSTQEAIPGRMGAGAPMVGQDLPVAPQTQADGAAATDNSQHARPHVRPQPPRQRPPSYAQKGSTRQVFVNTMRSAP